jgi:hypothetical protein
LERVYVKNSELTINIQADNQLKKSLVLAIFILCGVCLSAQHYVGLKGAYGINSVDVVPIFETKSLTTVNNIGVLYRYEHKQYAALQVELNYVNKGFIKAVDTVNYTPEETSRITSVEIPLMAQGFIRFGAFRPYLTGGAVVGYILSRSQQITGESKRAYTFDEYDRRFEYGIAGGAGLGVRFSFIELQAEWRYIYDFSFLRTPVIYGQDETRTQTFNTTRMEISLSVLYRF